MMRTTDSKERFSNRVADYIRYRPGYPRAVLDLLRDECALKPESVVADVGSGTGILTRLFLDNGNSVYGVEPNAEMRQAGEEFLATYRKFRSVAAAAAGFETKVDPPGRNAQCRGETGPLDGVP